MDDVQLEQRYHEFLVNGITVLGPQALPEVDHDLLYRSALGMYADLKAKPSTTAHLDMLGDQALVQRIPELETLLGATRLVQVLQCILGEDYVVHPHCFLHEAGSTDQVFHQDGNLPWNERGHYRSHRPDWALLFYYPQAVTLANGPTEVAPGTQYWTKDFERSDGTYHSGDAFDRQFYSQAMGSGNVRQRDQRNTEALLSLGVPNVERQFVTVPQGSLAICHYDLVHRGSRQAPHQAGRYMFKFFFARTKLPRGRRWSKPSLAELRKELRPVVDDIYRWTDGSSVDLVSASIEELAQQLTTGREDQKIAAAYRLAHLAEQQPTTQAAPVAASLLDGIQHDQEGVRRAAAYGIRALGEEASCVVPYLDHRRVSVRRLAAFALGTEKLASDALVAEALIQRLLVDEDILVRSNAAYALGQIGRAPMADAAGLIATLLQRLEPGVEANNTEVAGLPRSTVRQSVAYALLQLLTNHSLPARLGSALEDLLEDKDRYVAGIAQAMLSRVRA